MYGTRTWHLADSIPKSLFKNCKSFEENIVNVVGSHNRTTSDLILLFINRKYWGGPEEIKKTLICAFLEHKKFYFQVFMRIKL